MGWVEARFDRHAIFFNRRNPRREQQLAPVITVALEKMQKPVRKVQGMNKPFDTDQGPPRRALL
jgi:hypothetical protein